MKKRRIWMLAVVLTLCCQALFTSCSSNHIDETGEDIVSRQYCTTVQHFVDVLEANPEVKKLVEKSIAAAKAINPDRITNPAQTLTEYYNFFSLINSFLY